MRSPVRLMKDADLEAVRLRDAVREEVVTRKGVELKELSARTGRSDGYWSQVFGGKVTFTAGHLFAALYAVETEPAEFFARFYGIRGNRGGSGSGDEIEDRVTAVLRRLGVMPGEGESGAKAAI